jgi:hypothetical protein
MNGPFSIAMLNYQRVYHIEMLENWTIPMDLPPIRTVVGQVAVFQETAL